MTRVEEGPSRNPWFFWPNRVMFGVPLRGHPNQEGG
jgi:hypothetical protein